ncbi:MAG: hypothetical protein ABI895_14820 [Deltaproteobacteria bacterium]
MGSAPVSEAAKGPSGRSDAAASPPSRVTARQLPPRLRLAEASPSRLRFVGWWPARAPLLLSPVWLVLSGLTWFAPTPPDALRLLVSLACLGVGLGLIAACRPRRVEVLLQHGAGRLTLAPGWVEQVAPQPHWVLVTEQPLEAPRPRYAALLVDGERSWPLLRARDPAQLLRELRSVLLHWPGEVEQAWGLPSSARPWSFRAVLPVRDLEAPAERAVLRGLRAPAGLRWALRVITGLVLLDLTFLVISASAHVLVVHSLSLILPTLSGLCLLVICIAVATRHARLVIGTQITLEERVLGLRLARQQVRSDSVRGAYVVAAGGGAQHLLVDSNEGPLALLIRARDAERLREELKRSLARSHTAPASESIASAPRRWQSG